MKPLIETLVDEARIRSIAESWIGTQYIPDGAIKGTGTSCSALPYAILHEFGADIPPPPARGLMLKKDILPLMLSWLTEHEGTHFRRLSESEPHAIGDVMLFDAGIGHLGMCVGADHVVHCIQTLGTTFEHYRSTRLQRRLVGVWRPIKP